MDAHELALRDRDPLDPALPELEVHRMHVLGHGRAVVQQPKSVLVHPPGDIEVLVAEGEGCLLEAVHALDQ